jgi:ABC-type dipeptide/oligopeptide/nickel transport system ATPase component
MQEYWKYKRGSEWRKWDLHIHSDASDGKINCEQIINKAIEKGIDVIALTDHHTFKNIDNIKALSKDKAISVISGIEFRTEYGKKSVHILALFPNEFNGIALNTKHLTDLILSPLGLAEINIITKGKEKLIKEGKSEISDNEAFKKGMFLVQVDFKKAANLVHEYGGLIIPHAGQKENGIDKEMRHVGKIDTTLYNSLGTVKEELFNENYIDICEISKENDNEQFYLDKFNKPSIITSDAHELNEVGSKYTWIKADPTFEGLQQIVYEPKGRTKIQLLKPEQKNDRHVISEIQFKSSDKLFGNQKILLNDNLNAIIGGKSSGKSLLLHSIANSIDPEQVNRITKRLNFEGYSFKDESYDFEVTWKNNDRDTLNDNVPENKIRKIAYIPQLYINYLAEKNNKKDLNILVGNILLQDDLYKLFFDNKTKDIADVSNKIEVELNNLLSIRVNGLDLNRQLKEIGASKIIADAIKKLEKQISDGQKLSNLSQEEVDNYNDLLKKREKAEKELALIKTKENVLKSFSDELVYSKNNLVGIENQEKYLSQKGKLDKILEVFNDIPDDIIAIKELISKDFETLIANLQSEVVKLKLSDFNESAVKELDKLKLSLAPFLKKFAGQKELEKLTEQVEKEKQKKLKSELLEKQFKNAHEEYINSKMRITDLLKERYILYKSIIARVNETENEIGEEITLKCSLIYKKENFIFFEQANKAMMEKKNFFNSLFSKNQVNYDLIPDTFQDLLKITDDITLNLTNNRVIPLKQKTKIDEIFKGFVKDGFEFDYKVSYKNDELLQMSPGKKGTVLLILFLQISSAEYPILIDQPEDNLDNRTIYDLLCKIVKETKINRQIIIVSHNANLVVATDSENIIVANQEGQDPEQKKSEYRFEYVNGALEYSSIKDEKIKGILYQQGIKEHVCDILEGGNEAFKQRERKYAIK